MRKEPRVSFRERGILRGHKRRAIVSHQNFEALAQGPSAPITSRLSTTPLPLGHKDPEELKGLGEKTRLHRKRHLLVNLSLQGREGVAMSHLGIGAPKSVSDIKNSNALPAQLLDE